MHTFINRQCSQQRLSLVTDDHIVFKLPRDGGGNRFVGSLGSMMRFDSFKRVTAGSHRHELRIAAEAFNFAVCAV